jgi:hypothetical protein
MVLFFACLYLASSALKADIQVIAFDNFFFKVVVEMVFFGCQFDRVNLVYAHDLDLFFVFNFTLGILYLNVCVSTFYTACSLFFLIMLKRCIQVRPVREDPR